MNRKSLIVAVLLVCLVAIGWTGYARRTGWEYQVVLIGKNMGAPKILNDYGRDGWELVSIKHFDNSVDMDGTYIFKRAR